MKAFDTLIEMNPESGLYPIYISNKMNKPQFATKKITLGAMGDSFYEYLLKVWLQGGRKENKYREMYDQAVDGIEKVLLRKSLPNGLAYVADFDGSEIEHKMDHLVCFLPGGIFVLYLIFVAIVYEKKLIFP